MHQSEAGRVPVQSQLEIVTLLHDGLTSLALPFHYHDNLSKLSHVLLCVPLASTVATPATSKLSACQPQTKPTFHRYRRAQTACGLRIHLQQLTDTRCFHWQVAVTIWINDVN